MAGAVIDHGLHQGGVLGGTLKEVRLTWVAHVLERNVFGRRHGQCLRIKRLRQEVRSVLFKHT